MLTIKYKNMEVNINNLPRYMERELIEDMKDIDEIKGLLFFKQELKKESKKCQ